MIQANDFKKQNKLILRMKFITLWRQSAWPAVPIWIRYTISSVEEQANEESNPKAMAASAPCWPELDSNLNILTHGQPPANQVRLFRHPHLFAQTMPAEPILF
jgi:hypothetical protein